MSSYAFSDLERKKIIFANQCTINDKYEKFYCENPICNAKLTLRSLNSPIRNPYFAALKDDPHIKNCYFNATHQVFNEAEYDETLFNFNEIITTLLEDNFQKIPRRINTLSQIYHMSKSRHIESLYNNIPIWKILCDVRSNRIYTKGILGSHLVECRYHYYKSEEKYIAFKYPLNDLLDNQYNLRIYFSDQKFFMKIRDLIFNLG